MFHVKHVPGNMRANSYLNIALKSAKFIPILFDVGTRTNRACGRKPSHPDWLIGMLGGFSLWLIRKEETPILTRIHGAEIDPKGEFFTRA